MAQKDIAVPPTPEHITILFKCHKSTTLLSLKPDQEFSTIKPMLLAALRSRNLTTFPGSDVPLPKDPEDIELGVLADRKDYNKGWISMDAENFQSSDAKSGKGKGSSKKPTIGSTPSDAGMSDGTWIAYRLKSEREADRDQYSVPDIEMVDESPWDVVLPSFEDETEEVE